MGVARDVIGRSCCCGACAFLCAVLHLSALAARHTVSLVQEQAGSCTLPIAGVCLCLAPCTAHRDAAALVCESPPGGRQAGPLNLLAPHMCYCMPAGGMMPPRWRMLAT